MKDNKEKDDNLTNKIICYNCDRLIDVSDIEIGTIFKCKQCYSTLIKTDYFKTSRKNIMTRRNKVLTYGIALGVLPMPLMMYFITTKPVEIVIFYLIIDILMVYSIKYFSKIANDILFAIAIAELGIFANITRIILQNFTIPKYLDKVNDLSFQTYFLLIFSVILMILGLRRRKRLIQK
jgi:uncharacterized paraquat-inducible protein A